MSAVRTTCPYCGVGCGVSVAVGGNGITVAGDETHPANLGRLCSKGSALGETLDLDGRLLYPEIGGTRVSWDRALDEVARGFSTAITEHGPDAVAFYVSGQLLTEDYYVANKLMKGFIGSGNIDTNSRLCMASAVAGYKRAFGADYVPNAYSDIERADLLVMTGANMAWCHPVLFQRARAAKEGRGLEVVVIDPRRTASCDIADLHLAVKPGSDVMLFNGLLAYLARERALDEGFIAEHTEGFEAALATARASAPSVSAVAAACDVPARDVADFYRLFARSDRTVTLFSQGVNQSTSGTDKAGSIINVHLATGRVGKAGAGPFSLTGQPNAMGGREVGGLANQLAAHMDFTPDAIDRVARFWQTPRVAATPGLKAVDLFAAVGRGEIKAIWIMSTNPVVSMPDVDAVAAALERCDFVVVSDCVARTDTTPYADVLLPAAAWGEKSGTVTNSERRISRQRAFLPAPGEARPDWWITAEVARRMGFVDAFGYASPADVFREHARLSGFENDGARDFDIGRLAGVTDAEYDMLEPVRWPLPAARPGAAGAGVQGRSAPTGAIRATAPRSAVALVTREPLADGRFFTASGRAHFVATEPRPPAAAPTEQFPFVLVTGRLRDQWHTMTRTGKSPRLSQTGAEPCVAVHPADAACYDLAPGGLARVTSARGTMLARVETSTGQRRGEVFLPMHWNDQYAREGRVGRLIAAAVDPHSGQPELKATPVALARVEPAWQGFVLCRERLELGAAFYATSSRGRGYWRHELAGVAVPSSWGDWARAVLGGDGEWVEFLDAGTGRYRGARLDGGRLAACAFITRTSGLPDRGWLGSLFAEESLSDAARASLLAARPAAAAAATGPVICSCFGVGRDTLLGAIRSQRLTTRAEIGQALKAGTNCGSCIPELNDLLAVVDRERGAEAGERAVG